MQSNQESRARAELSLFDLSQRGNGQALRNTFIDGQPVRISGTSKLPMEVCCISPQSLMARASPSCRACWSSTTRHSSAQPAKLKN